MSRQQARPTSALCQLDEIPDGEAHGFTLDADSTCTEVFVVRKGAEAFAYINSCPHAHWPLELIDNQFMTLDKRHIQCVNHGAWFEIETGLCLGGPCAGKSLKPFPVQLTGGWVICGS